MYGRREKSVLPIIGKTDFSRNYYGVYIFYSFLCGTTRFRQKVSPFKSCKSLSLCRYLVISITIRNKNIVYRYSHIDTLIECLYYIGILKIGNKEL